MIKKERKNSHVQIFELCHVYKGFISYLPIMDFALHFCNET